MIKIGYKIYMAGNKYRINAIFAPTSDRPLYDIAVDNGLFRFDAKNFEAVESINGQLLLFW